MYVCMYVCMYGMCVCVYVHVKAESIRLVIVGTYLNTKRVFGCTVYGFSTAYFIINSKFKCTSAFKCILCKMAYCNYSNYLLALPFKLFKH